jgi:hypothetical protein
MCAAAEKAERKIAARADSLSLRATPSFHLSIRWNFSPEVD